jgi:Glycosyl transferase family 2
MMTDQDVIDLYRCLLNRAPERADTIAAFKAYYTDFAAGRQAVLDSAEFARLCAEQSGGAAALIANAMIRASAAAAPTAAEDAIAARLRDMLRRHGAVRLAVVADKPCVPLEVLLPMEDGAACVLHADRRYETTFAGLREFPGARALIETNAGPAGVAEIVRQSGLQIDVLAIGSDPDWFDALRPHIASRAILISGQDFPAAIDAWERIERTLRVGPLHIRHLGGWFLPVRYESCPADDLPHDVPRLALAAIVRNEQDAIVNMLASVAPVAYCFVILDTGSSDETAARAATFLQSTGKPWTLRRIEAERFDVMRNAALDLVPPEADWVLMLDADEELAPEDHAKLLDLLRRANQDAYALPRYNYLVAEKEGDVSPYPDRQVRLLRNLADRSLRYEGAVHETVRGVPVCRLPLDAGAIGQGTGGPHIHHMVRRYRSAEAEARKQERYRAIAARYGGEK